jgi:parvulin-like peptidyl-prolyl isomerase
MQFNEEPMEEPKERTYFWWVVVGLLLLLMVAAFWFLGPAERTGSQVHAKHILIKTNFSDPVERQRALERLTELKERIEGGESFEKIAEEYSEDPISARKGGDLGWAPKGTYTGQFEDYVWVGPVGEVSDVVRTSHGFHLIKIVDRRLSEVDRYQMERQQEDMLEEELAPE